MPVGYGTAFVPTQLRKVTNLNPSGSGSFTEALTTPANGAGVVIVFDGLSGSINRIGQSDIITNDSKITIAGETGNVTVIGGTLRFKSNDLEMRHMRLLAGDEPGLPNKDNRDSLGIEGNAQPQRIWVHHCTLGWSTDGLLDIWPGSNGLAPRSITVEDNIFAEALENAGHTEGPHSTGILLGKGSTDILIHRNFFTGITRRNPAIHPGCNVAVINNLLYNVVQTYEMYPAAAGFTGSLVDVIGNHMVVGPSSPWWKTAPGYEPAFATRDPTSKVYNFDNITTVNPALTAIHAGYANLNGFPTNTANISGIIVSTPQTVLPAGLVPMSSSLVKNYVTANAGPVNRTVFESRLINEVLGGTAGSIKDTPIPSEKEFFGFPSVVNLEVHMKGWETL